MGSISGDVNSGPLQCTTAADLASRPVASLKVGDWAYVIAKQGTSEGPLFFWSPASVLGASASVIVSTAVGGGAGRWLSFAVYGGVAAEIAPFAREFFVDSATAVSTSDQTGAVSAPFASIQQAIDALIAIVGATTGTVYVTSGYYPEELDFSGLVETVSLDIVGEGEEATILFGDLAWTAAADQSALGIRFRGLCLLGNVDIDGTAAPEFLSLGAGFTFQDCLVLSNETLVFTACGRIEFLNTRVASGNASFIDCGTVRFVGARIAITVQTLFSYDPTAVTYPSLVEMFGSTFSAEPSGVVLRGDVVVVADSGTSFTSVLIGNSGPGGLVGAVSFTSCSRFLDGLSIALAGTGGDDVAAVVDISRCSFAGALTAIVTGGVGRTTLLARNAVFDEDATINLQSKVDADLRNATFNQQNLTGNPAATCKRSVYYTNEDISLAAQTIPIANPPFPDTNYTIELTPIAVIATSPWAITAKAAASFEVSLTAPNPGLLADIVLTPFDNAPP